MYDDHRLPFKNNGAKSFIIDKKLQKKLFPNFLGCSTILIQVTESRKTSCDCALAKFHLLI